jgi:hypothetical protein
MRYVLLALAVVLGVVVSVLWIAVRDGLRSDHRRR